MRLILGLDLGITNVGYGIIDEDFNIIDYGVREFEESSASFNKDRRDFRGQRRLKSRKRNRIVAIKYLLRQEGIIDDINFPNLKNVYDLRCKGLNEKLSNIELANVLVNLAKHRGQSYATAIDEDDSEAKENQNSLEMNTLDLKTRKLFVCQLQKEKLEKDEKIRDTNNIFSTDDYKKELRQILSKQGLSSELNDKIEEIIFRRRRYSEGPGSEKFPTKYGSYRYDEDGQIKKVNLIDEMRGRCSIYPNEFRAPKNSYSACLFNLLNDLNNLKVSGNKLSEEQKRKVLKDVKEKGSLTPAKLCKLLNVKENDVTGFRIDKNRKNLLTKFDFYDKLLKAGINKDIIYDEDKVDQMAEILTKTQVIDERIASLKELNYGFTEDEIVKIAKIAKINGYHSLSFKAIKEYNEELLVEPLNQQQITSKKHLDKNLADLKGSKIKPDDTAILSPVAKRVHREAIKVVNALRDKYGEFARIVIETTRDKNTDEEKKRIQDNQKYFKEQKDKTNQLIEELGKEPDKINNQTKIKLRLAKEQNYRTIYAGIPIDIDRLIKDPNAYEIEHIIPYSISFDNSLNNKALASKKENQDKGQNTPFYYFKSGKVKDIQGATITLWDEYIENIKSLNNISRKKKEYLTSEKDYSRFINMEEFIARNLIDTSYSIRSIMQTLKAYFEVNGIDTNIFTVRGRVTSDFRKRAALSNESLEKNRDKYIHHAVDSLIIAALSNNKLIKTIYSLEQEENNLVDKNTGEVFDNFENVLNDERLIKFVKSLGEITGNPFNFSYKIDTKVNRSIADQTIYSTRNYDGEDYIISKYKDIYGNEGEKLAKRFQDGKANDLLVAINDPQTFDILKGIYEQYKHEKNPFLAYKNEHGYIRKYAKDGNGPIIKQLKYKDDKLGSHLDISKKYDLTNSSKKVVLLQNTPYRTDVYLQDGVYKFVTVRRYHVFNKNGKNVIDKEVYENLLKAKGISEKAEFKFSLYKNSIVDIRNSGDKGMHLYRFVGTNNDSTNRIELKLIEEKGKRITPTIGKKIIVFDKYNVSPIGEYQKVTNEVLKLEW